MNISKQFYKNGQAYFLAVQRKGHKLHLAEGSCLLEAMRECMAMVINSKVQEAQHGAN